jgi:deaminated glutathione amidase
MSLFRIACAQLCTGIDPHKNADTLRRVIAQAAEAKAHLIQTPEMTGLMDKNLPRFMENVRAEAEDSVLAAAQEGARQHKMIVHVGSLAIKTSTPDERFRCVNRGYIIDLNGGIRARYDKIHLFDADLPTGERWRESTTYSAGDEAVVVQLPLPDSDATVGYGLSICYDIRFCELYRALAISGAEILTAPAAFTSVTGAAHWHVLQRARAIENGAFMASAAQTGVHEDGRSTYGHSIIVDPWGGVLAEAATTPTLIMTDLDLEQVRVTRQRIPVLAHPRVRNPAPYHLEKVSL